MATKRRSSSSAKEPRIAKVVSSSGCPRCGEEEKIRLRSFSDQAVAALVTWEEMEAGIEGKPICDGCYDELREVLIDRAAELESFPAMVAKKGVGRPADIKSAS